MAFTFQERIQAWVGNTAGDIRRFGPLWFVLLVVGYAWGFIKELVLDRATGSVNTWLDNNAPEAVKFIKAHMPLFPQSELGLVGWIFFLIIFSILIHAYWDTLPSRREIIPAPVSPPSLPLSPPPSGGRRSSREQFVSFINVQKSLKYAGSGDEEVQTYM